MVGVKSAEVATCDERNDKASGPTNALPEPYLRVRAVRSGDAMVHVSGTLKTHLANSRFSPVVEPGGEHGWWCVILGRREMLAHNEGFDGRVSATLAWPP